jgi:hypothetical protein
MEAAMRHLIQNALYAVAIVAVLIAISLEEP